MNENNYDDIEKFLQDKKNFDNVKYYIYSNF